VTVTNAGGFNFANATTTRADGFIQDEISLLNNRWILTPGIRYATYELDPRPNPFYKVVPGKEPRDVQSEKLVKQLGSVFKLDEHFSLVGRYAEGFKMPTAQQRYTSLPGGAGTNSDLIPNPNLRPEQVKSYEVGLRGQFSQGYFSATVFKADYTDFIQNFVETPSINFPGIFDLTYQNLSKVNLLGVEFASQYRFTDYWSANFAVAYTQGTQKINATSAETAFDGTTPFSGVMGVRYSDRPNGFDAQLIATWSAGALPRSSPTLYRQDGYIVFDAVFGYAPQMAPGLTLRASVLNIADTRYFPPFAGTTTYANTATAAVAVANPIELRTAPGRTFKVGASYAF
jgi:hemoglobin/transferrin/lactoferrin receptor protein